MRQVREPELPGFGKLLKRYRRESGFTQEMLAERAGYSAVYVSMLERGRRTPVPATVETLADALELPPSDRGALRSACRGAVSVPSLSLVGRKREMRAIERHLSGEGPPILVLAGEPGIGKSHLLRQTIAPAEMQEWKVLHGGCLRRGGQEPYAPFLEALGKYIHNRAAAELHDDLRGCTWLAQLLPELLDGVLGPLPASTPPEQGRRLMCDALIRFLTNISGGHGVLLLLDDLQWAGADALELVAVLARAAPTVPLRIVAAYRDVEVHDRHILATVLADLAHAQLVTHVSLGPLEREDAEHFLDRLLDEEPINLELRQRLLSRAGGVPFFLASCAEAVRIGAVDPDGNADLPWDVTQSIHQRVASLPRVARDLLGLAAVRGRTISRYLLLHATAHPEAEVLDALETACHARLLEEDGDNYRFSHDVIREVVEADMSRARRTLLHQRIATMLMEQPGGAPAEVLAYHWARSDNDEQAIHWLERAGDLARAQHANATAEGYYREMMDHLDVVQRPLEAAMAREKLGSVLTVVGRYDAALTVLEEAAATFRLSEDLDKEARAVAQIGRVHALRGTPEEGIQRLESIRDTLAALKRSANLAALNAALAPLYLARGRYREQLKAAVAAADLASLLRDEQLLVEAEVLRGCALNQLGQVQRGQQVLEDAIPRAESAGNLSALSHALNDLGYLHEVGGQFSRSKHYRERALRVAAEGGDQAAIANMTFRLGQNAYLAGRWQEARDRFERSAALARDVGSSSILAYPLFGLSLLSLAQGLPDVMEKNITDCMTVAENSGDMQMKRAIDGLLAERDLLIGRPMDALSRLEGLDTSEEGLSLAPRLPILAAAYLACGFSADAERILAEVIARTRAQNDLVCLVDARRIGGLVAIESERWNQADTLVAEGLKHAETMPYPFAQARLLVVYAMLYERRGENVKARCAFEQALSLYRQLGADAYARHARTSMLMYASPSRVV